MATYKSNDSSVNLKNFGKKAYVQADVSYSRSGTTGYNVTVTVYLKTYSTSSSCPFYAYSCNQYCSINGVEKRNTRSANPNASWPAKTGVQLWSVSQFVDPGGPAFDCGFYVKYEVPAGQHTFSSAQTFTINSTINLPSTYVAASQTYVTKITNNTSGSVKNSGDQSIASTWWENNNTNTNYAGDSLTLWWDKNNEANVGVNADPTSKAFLTRDSDNNHDAYDAVILQPWDWTGGGGDLYSSQNYTISTSDCNCWLKCMMWKSMLDSGGTRQHYLQGALEYVKPAPTMDAGGSLRSKRFYTGTPSCKVWQVTKMNLVTNGYGMSQIGSNNNSPKYVNNNNVPYKFIMTLSTGGEVSGGAYRFGSGIFNGNYSLGSTIDVHTAKTSTSGTPSSDAIFYSNWFNPRTGAVDRLGYLSASLGRVSVVSGSITLPTIDSILPISGNGTTVVVDSSKRIYTNQSNVKITYKVAHSGNSNGFGYDARVSGNSGTYASTSGEGTVDILPVQLDLWSGNYGVLNHTSNTVTLQHDSIPTTGSSRTIAIVPYITDSGGYKIFGAANTPNGLVTSTPYTIYKITKPNVPTLSKWSNTLPAIDGVKDRIQWSATSPSSWGNVIDFTTGFKLKYKIGADKARSDGYEWYFTDSPSNTSTSFSGHFDETYDRSLNTASSARLAATSRYDTVWDSYLDFQSDFTTEKSFNITAKTPYNQTTGTLTMDPSNGNHTVLATEVPFIFTCPNQDSLNATDLIKTTTMIIDGGTPVEISNPDCTLGTANGLTGLRNVTWSSLRATTTALARGAHTLKVECEVLSYFKSTTPIENNVYLGASKVASPVMNIEVAEMPKKPTMRTPSPAFYNAGQERTMTFPWTTNDWGCLDTTNNNRHFEYQLLNPAGKVISSGTIAKDKTSWSYTFTPNNTNLGTYTFKLKEVTVVGDSGYATQTFEILKAIEPDKAAINTTQIIALNGWGWDLSIVPGNNGSFKPVTTAPITRYKVDVIQPGYNMYNASFNNLSPSITAVSDGWYKLNINNTGNGVTFSNFFTKYNSHVKSDTNYTYVIEVRNVVLNKAKNGSISLSIGNTGGQGSWMDYSVDSDTLTQIKTGSNLSITEAGTYFIPVKTKVDTKSLGGSGYSTPTDSSMLSRDFFTIPAGDNYSMEFRVSLVEGKATASDFAYQAYTEPPIKNIVTWTNSNNGTNIAKSYTHDLGSYTDGSYWFEITYERYYTTKKTTDVYHTQIIPPEVNISDLSYVVVDEVTEDVIPLMVNIEVFASTLNWNCYYSIDYEKTWIEIPLTETIKAKKYFRVKLPLKYLDVIRIKAFGSNPVDQELYTTQREMPSSYKVWLSYANRDNSDRLMLGTRYPKTYNASPYLVLYKGGTGDSVKWENNAVKYSTADTTTTELKGFYFVDIGEKSGMVNGKKYRIAFKARSTTDRSVKVSGEPLTGPYKERWFDLTKEFKTFYVEGVYSSSSIYKALSFYSNEFGVKERLYVKDITIAEIKAIPDVDIIRRLNVSISGDVSKKLTHLSKK